MRFNHFESLIKQRGRIDRDLRAHVPGWMFQRLFYCDLRKLLGWCFPKRPTRCRKDDAADIGRLKCGSGLSTATVRGTKAPPTLQALKNRVVLATNREHMHSFFERFPHHNHAD